MSTDTPTANSSDQTDTDQTDSDQARDDIPPAGFVFSVVGTDHKIEEAYSWRYVDEIVVSGGSIKRYRDDDGYFGEDSEFSCVCGQAFDTEEEAIRHLKRYVTARQPPLPEPPKPITWSDNHTTIHGGAVPLELDEYNTFGKVTTEAGAEYLVATAREHYRPPEKFAFESWDPLASGRMQWPDETPMFRPASLARALNDLVDGGSYPPERYTIHFRGKQPLLVEGPTGGIVVAPSGGTY